MRRICMLVLATSALSATSVLSGSAYADSIQNIFSPFAPEQPAYDQPQQQAPQMAPAAPPAPANNGYIPQRGLFTSGQQAPAGYAPPPAQNGGGFFGALFGHAASASYQPAAPSYAPSGQGDMANPQNYQIDPQYEKQTVEYPTDEPAGTIVVDTPSKFLYLVEGGGKAMRYGIGVGKPGFTWAGVKTITAKKEWPDWRPPPEMLQRRPDLPRYMPGGEDNPLGARAMYLGSTLYRIHGSNEPWTIGTNVSSGCIRMRNQDVEDLYDRVKVGTKVVVI
jgi:lipoprotein-anchoring transpeptidase ErfK/SrfK